MLSPRRFILPKKRRQTLGSIYAFPRATVARHQSISIFADGELDPQAVVKESFTTAAENGDIVSQGHMEERTAALYLDYDRERKTREALQANQQDEGELKALEARIKQRKLEREKKNKA